jgi:hypothetical protein
VRRARQHGGAAPSRARALAFLGFSARKKASSGRSVEGSSLPGIQILNPLQSAYCWTFVMLSGPRSSDAVKRAWVLGAVGVVARLALLVMSKGSNDAFIWEDFAHKIREHGVGWMYVHAHAFNHPPIMGYWAGASLAAAAVSGLRFAVLFKLPAVLADMGSALLLAHIWRERGGDDDGWKAFALYGVSLTSILVSSYHCSTDAVCAFFCLLCAYAICHKRPLGAGLALAAALNVKLIPLVLVAPALSTNRSFRAFLLFGSGLAVGLVPFIPFLLEHRAEFLRNTTDYAPLVDRWGVCYLASESAANPSFGPSAARFLDWYVRSGRYGLLAGIGLVSAYSFLRRKLDAYELFSVCLCIFLVLAPGFGVQYTIHLCPVLFAVNLGRGTRFSLLAGAFIGLIYLSWLDVRYPWTSHFDTLHPMPTPLVGLVAWGYTAWLAYRILRRAACRRAGAIAPV